MTSYTENLNLAKQDTGAQDWGTVLNENFDKIDAGYGQVGGRLSTLVSQLTECHVVIKTYVNGTSWYRLCSDNWCEQGGEVSTGSGAVAVVLLKSFVNTNYSIQVTSISKDGTNPQYYAKSIIDKQTANFSINQYSNYFAPFSWKACGYVVPENE